MSARAEDYGLIGDLQPAAPLGTEENGHWRIQPEGAFRAPARSYRGGALVLETQFDTPHGAVRLIDFMPPRETRPDLVRIVEDARGRVQGADGARPPLRPRVDRPLGAQPARDAARDRGPGCRRRARNDLGLLSEEYDTERRRLVGNFPQAFTHRALVETAFTLARTAPRGRGS